MRWRDVSHMMNEQTRAHLILTFGFNDLTSLELTYQVLMIILIEYIFKINIKYLKPLFDMRDIFLKIKKLSF